MGESMSDFMGQHSVPIAGAVGILGLAFALWLQMRTPEYRAPVYWFAVMMVAVFGTMAADGVHDGASIPYAVTTPIFAAVVAAVFFFWQRSESTLSIHSITTRRRESYYWAAVLATFALGTAAGDLTATSLNFGFLGSAVLFAVLIAIPALAWWRGKLNPIAALDRLCHYETARCLSCGWRASHICHRPGTQRRTVSALALGVFVLLVAYVAITKRDIQVPYTMRPGSLSAESGEDRALA